MSVLSDVDKGHLTSLMEILKKFHDCSVLVQADQQTTISSVVPLIYRLQKEWLVTSANPHVSDISSITNFKLAAKKKLEHFYPFEKTNAAWKATALDPQFDIGGFLSRDIITAIWKDIIQESSRGISDAAASIMVEELEVEYEVEEEGEVEETGQTGNLHFIVHSYVKLTSISSPRIQQKKAYIEPWLNLWINSKEE